MDHDGSKAVVPMVELDLTSASGIAILWDILRSPSLFGVHLGLPCGTASLARERPVSKELQAQGAPNPPPLRSAEFPLGVPGLSDYNLAKITSANKLYSLAVEIILFCHQKGIIISVENPANSWLWAALVQLTIQHSEQASIAYNALHKVLFHACCHGSTRRKSTGWLSTPGIYAQLEATCQNNHTHDAWGVHWKNGEWVFDTSSEAAYPTLLAQRAAECLVKAAKQRKLPLQPPLRIHDVATAAQGTQTRKHRALVPEFHHFSKQPVGDPVQPGTKLLAPHLMGCVREELEVFQGVDLQSSAKEVPQSANAEAGFAKVGVYHTPEQFLQKAMQLQHPVDSTDHLAAITKEAIQVNLKYPHELVKLERKKNLLFAKLLSAQTQDQERALHDSLPGHLQKVLDGKRILVWEQLLKKFEYDDLEVVRFMKEGVHIVGAHDTPPCYPEKIRAASLTKQDLESSAIWRRRAIMGKRHESRDSSHVAHLEETAAEEVSMGFVEGPFFSEAQVTSFFGHDRWMIVRRFVLVQGAEQKLRPIDDCLEAQLNMGFTSTTHLQLQDVDYIAALALKIATAVSAGQQRFGSGVWKGKCLDLSKAYKQMGIHPSDRHLAVIYFEAADGSPRFYVSNSLMFGSTAAVYSFNRVSRSIWWLFNRMLHIPCGVFYDDYPLFSPAELAEDADFCASALLDVLGWRHARTGPKGLPFDLRFQVLGCSLDLERVPCGEVITENKPGRIGRLKEYLSQLETSGKMSLNEAQVLHGLLRYSCGFFAGKHLYQVCSEVMQFMSASAVTKRSNVSSFCRYASDMLSSGRPRVVSAAGERRPVLIFTDGSWEAGKSGLGAVILDPASGSSHVLSGEVPEELIRFWCKQSGEQVICQIELFAMVVIRWQFRDLLADRRVIWFVDNEAARFSTIKGLSATPTMQALVREFFRLETVCPTFPWIERVPSYSNPSDGASRGSPEEIMHLLQIPECQSFQPSPALLSNLLQTSRSMRKG